VTFVPFKVNCVAREGALGHVVEAVRYALDDAASQLEIDVFRGLFEVTLLSGKL
jgi:CYTH domain-containing protein